MSISQRSSKRRRVNHREEEGKSDEEDMDFDLGEALRIVDEELQKEKESKQEEVIIPLNPKKRSFSAAFTEEVDRAAYRVLLPLALIKPSRGILTDQAERRKEAMQLNLEDAAATLGETHLQKVSAWLTQDPALPKVQGSVKPLHPDTNRV
jgi:hypothetical protein